MVVKPSEWEDGEIETSKFSESPEKEEEQGFWFSLVVFFVFVILLSVGCYKF